MSLKALMVDVDGVVVRHPDGLRWDHAMKADLGLDPADLQRVFFAPHFEDVVLGRADLHDRLAPALAEVAPHLSAKALTDYWFSRDAHLDQSLLNALATVRAQGVQLHLATVQEHRRADYLWTTLGLKDRFEAIHYAAAYGAKKPDPAFFEAVCVRTGFAPREIVLIDDAAGNVEAATTCGWGAVLWDGTRTLAQALDEAGIVL